MWSKKGSLTIEASIALTAFMFLILTLFGFGRVYRAQNLISHATLQTSQSLAIESYYRETISSGDTVGTVDTLIELAETLGWSTASNFNEGYASLGDERTNFLKIVEETFIYAIADDKDSANQMLSAVGIEEGIDGLDFSRSAVNDSDIIINVRYEVKFPFEFSGERTVKLSKSAKTKAFKSISNNAGYEES